jgi:hypothetical protein
MRNVQAGNGAEPVYQVSRNVLAYIKEREKQLQISMSQSLQEIVGNPPYYGRMGDKPETEAKVYAATLQTFLETGSGPISQHIGAHGGPMTMQPFKDRGRENVNPNAPITTHDLGAISAVLQRRRSRPSRRPKGRPAVALAGADIV